MQNDTTLTRLMAQGFSPTILERFWRRVRKTEGCWLWTAGKTRNGYGSIHEGKHQGKATYAHRVSWLVHFGAIPEALFVCHHCDVPACVRPDHLFLGTQADNLRDMVSKNRQQKGEEHAHAKLTENQVRAIRLASGMQKVLAKQFGVCRETIRDIRNGKQWRHVQ